MVGPEAIHQVDVNPTPLSLFLVQMSFFVVAIRQEKKPVVEQDGPAQV